ncbi:hypothetical protein TNCV_2314111 [Trichonephila clavipes]|nr:hypothetical protein TNCV_2314111 [Trichonephila clavipes]
MIKARKKPLFLYYNGRDSTKNKDTKARWRGHREEGDLELNEDWKGKKRRGSDQHGGAIGHGRMSGIVGDDLNKMVLTT